MQPMPPCPAPTCWWRTWAFGPLLGWHLWLGTYFVVLFFFSWLCCPLRLQNSPKSHLWEGFLLFGNFSSFTTLFPAWFCIPNYFCLSFCLLYFVLPSLKENGRPFWVPGVLHQRSEVILWKLLSNQIIFWWICGGKSGLPVLLLCHLLYICPLFFRQSVYQI